MALSVAFLLASPALALLVFLGASAWHFGRSDIHDQTLLDFRETNERRATCRVF
jgi:hypothetical protein